MPAIDGQLSITTGDHGDQTILTAAGEIDLVTTPRLRQQLLELIEAGHFRLVLDLTGVSFCDSTGLGAMVAAFKRLRQLYADGHLRLVCDGPVLRVLELTELTRIFPVYDNLASALNRPGPGDNPAGPGKL